MKCVIQIPCYNEQQSIAAVLESLPRSLDGVDEIEYIVIDDGSTDRTCSVARDQGVDEVICLNRHLGLATAFSTGIQAALRRGADILVNTDADLQYPSRYIRDLVAPLLRGEADIAIGDRLSQKPAPFSFMKMVLQRLGSLFVRIFSGVRTVRDAASGFRAFNRDAMETMVIHSSFSYTLESIILAGMKKLRIRSVPITINKTDRKSRLFNSIPGYVTRSIISVIRAYLMYKPLKFFSWIGFFFFISAAALGLRFLWFYSLGRGAGHIQSLILLSIFTIIGFQSVVLGLLGDIISANRRLLEELRIKQLRENGSPPANTDLFQQ